MPDTLAFRLRLQQGPGFKLEVEERVPLAGITAISGPSGSGKTTLLRALAGLDREIEGRRDIRFGGVPWDSDQMSLEPEERRVGMVFQEPALFPHLSVAANVSYGARRRNVKNTEAIVEALDLGAMMNRDVTGLSGGEARRVALARALASNPSLMLLDEPMSGLDAERKAAFLPYVARAVSAARVPTIYVSHSTDEITALADRVLALRDGRSVGWMTPPMRLMAQVVGRDAAGMVLHLEGAPEEEPVVVSANIRAHVGERLGLGLPPDAVLLSADHPGNGTALASLRAEVQAERGPGGEISVRVLGQGLVLPPHLSVPAGAKHLWLSVLSVHPRPEPGDSSR